MGQRGQNGVRNSTAIIVSCFLFFTLFFFSVHEYWSGFAFCNNCQILVRNSGETHVSSCPFTSEYDGGCRSIPSLPSRLRNSTVWPGTPTIYWKSCDEIMLLICESNARLSTSKGFSPLSVFPLVPTIEKTPKAGQSSPIKTRNVTCTLQYPEASYGKGSGL